MLERLSCRGRSKWQRSRYRATTREMSAGPVSARPPQRFPTSNRAAREGAQLVVFPEYYLGRIAVPSPETERISNAAAGGRIYVIIGCWEVRGDGTFANTALLFDRMGKIIGKYQKVHAAVDHYEGEPPWSRPPVGKDQDWFIRNDPEWVMQRGNGFPVFNLDFGRIGILTCYDGWFPESFRVLSLKGAELLVWINGPRVTWRTTSSAQPCSKTRWR